MRSGPVGCIVLAAGLSSRMGSEKALLKVKGTTLLNFLIEKLSWVGIDPIVVTRAKIENDVKELVEGIEVIINPKPEEGRTGSIQVGITRINEIYGGNCRILIAPIDRPGFSIGTLERLVASQETTCPALNGRGGHPILISVNDAKRILQAGPEVPLRELVAPEKIEVNDQFLHLNVDTEAEMAKFAEILVGPTSERAGLD